MSTTRPTPIESSNVDLQDSSQQSQTNVGHTPHPSYHGDYYQLDVGKGDGERHTLEGINNAYLIDDEQLEVYEFLISPRYGQLSPIIVTEFFNFGLESFNDLYTVLGEFDATEAITFLDIHFGLDAYNIHCNDFIHILSIGAALDHQKASSSQPSPSEHWRYLQRFAMRSTSAKRKQLAIAFDQMIRNPMTWLRSNSYTGPISETRPTVHNRFEDIAPADDVIPEHISSIKTNSPFTSTRGQMNVHAQEHHIQGGINTSGANLN